MQLPETSPEYLLKGPRGTRLFRRTAAARRRSCDNVKHLLFIDFNKYAPESRGRTSFFQLKKKKKKYKESKRDLFKVSNTELTEFILTGPDCSECSARAHNRTGRRRRRGRTSTGRSSGPAAVGEAPAIGSCIPQPAFPPKKKRKDKSRYNENRVFHKKVNEEKEEK